MDNHAEDEIWAGEMPEVQWDIRREGHSWDAANTRPRRDLAPGRIELIDGKLFCTEAERVVMLGLLLENVGVDRAIRLGDPQNWRDAIAELD